MRRPVPHRNCWSTRTRGEEVPQGTSDSAPVPHVVKGECIKVRQERVEDEERPSRGDDGIGAPGAWVLVARSPHVVIPREVVKGAHLQPPRAQLLGGVLEEAADVGPHHRNFKLIVL